MCGIVFGLNVLVSDNSGGNDSQSWLGWLMSQPAGRWAVAVIGIVIIGAGLAHLVKGYQKQYDRFLQIPADKKRWTSPSAARVFTHAGLPSSLLAIFWFWPAGT